MDHARKRARDLNDRGAVWAAKGIRSFERDQKIQTLVEELGKRVRGIKTDRTQQRQQFSRKEAAHPANVRRHPVDPLEKPNAFVGKLRDQRVIQHMILFVNELMSQHGDAAQ